VKKTSRSTNETTSHDKLCMAVWRPRQCVTCDNVWWSDEHPRYAENAAAKVAAPYTIHIWTACFMMSGKRRRSSSKQRQDDVKLSISSSMGGGCKLVLSSATAAGPGPLTPKPRRPHLAASNVIEDASYLSSSIAIKTVVLASTHTSVHVFIWILIAGCK